MSCYLYFVPIVFSLILLGRTVTAVPFRPVFLIIGILLISNLCRVIFYSTISCKAIKSTDYPWKWYSVLYTGGQLEDYLLFVWLYLWWWTFLEKTQET